MFVDRVTIFVCGGAGGDGCMSFRREKYAPRGGPDGGDGGHGGHVVILATEGHTNLAHLSHQRHWKAERGEHGEGSDRFGRGGADLVIVVPPGTLLRDRDRGHVLRDLKAPGARVIVARGGRGGHGNAHYKSATNRAPRQFERGFAGEERWIVLELKVIADVGLIGLPNAGKSTLLSRISRAHPEIADYPFTTKYPNLGTVVFEDQTFVVADIPGLIEGAHAGHGLGHEFLRHVERTHLLVHLVEAVPLDGSEPLANYRTIRQELVEYSPTLAERPELLVVTKLDVTGAVDAKARIEQGLGRDVLGISAVTGKGIPQLLHRIAETLRQGRRSPTDAPDARESALAPARVLATPQNAAASPAGGTTVSIAVSSSSAGS
jgi:GTP-binding protein